MSAAAVVVFLVVFVVPISLLALALVVDAVFVLWVAAEVLHDAWRPRILNPLKHAAIVMSHRVLHVRHR